MQHRFPFKHAPLAALAVGLALSPSASAAAQTTGALPDPVTEHHLLPGVIDIQPSYGHWGLEGWFLFLTPQPTSTPGVCSLPRHYMGDPNFYPPQKPRDEREIYDEGLWLPLEHPLVGEELRVACADTRAHLPYVTNTGGGAREVGTMAEVFRRFLAASRDPAWVDKNVRCFPDVCQDSQRAVQILSFRNLGNGNRFTGASNASFTGWAIELRGIAHYPDVFTPMSGKIFIRIPDEIGPGSSIEIVRSPF